MKKQKKIGYKQRVRQLLVTDQLLRCDNYLM